MKAYWRRERPIELRPVSLRHYMGREKLEPVQHVWFRATGTLPDEAAIHKCVLAYASDMMLLDTSLYPHGRSLFDRDLQVASLDHALWFHRPFRADEWLLYSQDSPTASGGRGFNRGAIYTPRRHARRLGRAGGADPRLAGEGSDIAAAWLPRSCRVRCSGERIPAWSRCHSVFGENARCRTSPEHRML